MNTGKCLLYFFLGLILCSLSCSKRYDEDPITMKLVGLQKRILGEWQIAKILIDQNDYTSIIDVDSLQIFSIYHFSNYSNHHGIGKLEVKTKNEKHSYNRLEFAFNQSDRNNSVVFYLSENADSWDYLLKNKIIIPFGPINEFAGFAAGPWDIFKLTKKEFHVSQIVNSIKYELFFKKI